ncbi:flagellar transcriptional regulator FlhD [Cupriavidus sp. TMH.W2]|uniref:flagellar transcriptional regulator FlhD n=1 Tax=Cupriavidus sp. TMH.W2 TaxID=3434465 RepID=UPI003D76CCB4
MKHARQAGPAGKDHGQGPDSDSLREIKALNLSYLLLAQRLMRENEAEALFRLGIDRDVGRVLVSLTPPQMLALARSHLVLCRFRLDDGMLLAALTRAEPPHVLQSLHAAIVMATRRA